jgi:hypothetical protein
MQKKLLYCCYLPSPTLLLNHSKVPSQHILDSIPQEYIPLPAQGHLTKLGTAWWEEEEEDAVSNWKNLSIERVEKSFASSTKMDFMNLRN